MEDILIRCPKCKWEPGEGDCWMCSCGYTWNTFDTGGRCPACSRVWEHTQCLSYDCLAWSPHLDWYENLVGISEEIKEELIIPEKENAGNR